MRRFAALLAAVACVAIARPTPAQSPALIPLVVQGAPFDLNGPLFYAQDLGYFTKAGLDVKIQTSQITVEGVAAAILGGSLDIGSANTATIAQAHLHGIDFRFFAPSGLFTDTAAPTELVTVLKTSPYRTAADLNGKIVAVAGLKGMLQIATIAWADKHGGNGKSLQFVEVPFPQMNAALEQHRIDAAAITEPWATAATSGTARSIGSAEDGVAKQFMTLGWFSTAEWLKANPDKARRFATAIRQAAVWGNAHHQESAAILSKYSKMTLEVANSMGRCVYGLDLDPKLLQAPLDVAYRYGYLERPVQAADIMWAVPK
jgi:ABC-type nitrate/sulfonate/bicarbonate transport system substrate-binding protein